MPIPETLFGFAFVILAALVHAGIWMAICRKAGFSRLWGVPTLLIPAVLIVGIMLAVRRWPLHVQLRDARVRADAATDEEIYDYLGDGNRLERVGDFPAAMARYTEVAERFADRPPGQDALNYINALREKAGVLADAPSDGSGVS